MHFNYNFRLLKTCFHFLPTKYAAFLFYASNKTPKIYAKDKRYTPLPSSRGGGGFTAVCLYVCLLLKVTLL